MAEVKETIEVDVPVRTAYDQWTQFEEFPRFMEGVETVQQIDETHLLWAAEIGGQRHEWKAEITQQVPDEIIAWRATEGRENAGQIRFEPLGPARTRIDVTMVWEPEGVAEATADKIGMSNRAVKVDLQRFKELIESRGVETGAWRGDIQGGVETA